MLQHLVIPVLVHLISRAPSSRTASCGTTSGCEGVPQNGTCKGKAEGAVPLGGQQLERFDPKGHRVEVGNKVNELASPAQGEGKDGGTGQGEHASRHKEHRRGVCAQNGRFEHARSTSCAEAHNGRHFPGVAVHRLLVEVTTEKDDGRGGARSFGGCIGRDLLFTICGKHSACFPLEKRVQSMRIIVPWEIL